MLRGVPSTLDPPQDSCWGFDRSCEIRSVTGWKASEPIDYSTTAIARGSAQICLLKSGQTGMPESDTYAMRRQGHFRPEFQLQHPESRDVVGMVTVEVGAPSQLQLSEV